MLDVMLSNARDNLADVYASRPMRGKSLAPGERPSPAIRHAIRDHVDLERECKRDVEAIERVIAVSNEYI